ncbi:ABC transporter permease [Candidatus Daviesbacteria bacterium]|nr:ABC transporter permease [Candidatus Daviesbacteria bacterium]
MKIFKRYQRILLGIMVILLLVIIWQWAGSNKVINPLFISFPSKIISSGYELFRTGFIYKHLLISGQEFFLGYGLAVVFGVFIGSLVGRFSLIDNLLNPILVILYTIPIIALMPLLLIWLGLSFAAKVVIIMLAAIFPIIFNVTAGVRNVDLDLVKLAKSFGASEPQIFKTITFPSALPFILTGLRLAVGRGLIGLIIAELYGAQFGIGYLLFLYGATFQTDKFMVMILIIVLVGGSLTELLHFIEKRVGKWRQTLVD